MPLPISHSRLLGDSASRRATVIAGLVLLTSLVFYTALQVSPRSSSLSASLPKSVNLAQQWGTNIDLAGVDLFAMTSITEAKKPAYQLSSVDRVIYTRLFKAQQTGDWQQARALSKRVHDPILMGHVLYERYMAPDYSATYAELRDWMVKYGDHPQAYKVYQLAQKRRNNDPAALPAPQLAKKLLGSIEISWFSRKVQQHKASPKPLKRNEADISKLMSDIKSNLSDDKVTVAYNLLGSSKASRMLSAVEYDSLLGEIAAGYYYNGKYTAALRTAQQATDRSGKAVPVAHWIGGLSAWQNKEFKKAADHFEAIAVSHSRNPWMLSAGSFWAARAHKRMGHKEDTVRWLQEASSYPRTFYGLIAKAKLGKNEPFSWTAPKLTHAMVASLAASSSGSRALALLDIDQQNLAQQEFLQVHPNGDKVVEQALVAAADHFNLPKLALRVGNAIGQPDGTLYDVALYPIVPWKGDTTVNVDPALINALIRQESQFDTNASNISGAKGLMQLMPSTAQLVSDKSFDAKDLHNPDVNVALGQRYVRYLLKTEVVSGNLIYLAAAYNAGPGNLINWKKNVDHDNDPLLFIESLPYSETRAFIARVMTNYWIYSQRMTNESSTMESLRDGKWPIYQMPDPTMKMASSF